MWWSQLVSSLRLSLRRFTDRAIKVVNVAQQQAAQRGQAPATAEHLLLSLALVDRCPARLAMERLGLDLASEREAIARLVMGPPGELAQPGPGSATVEQLIDEAIAQARGLRHDYVGTEHLTLALLAVDRGGVAEFLRERGVSRERLREAVLAVLSGG
jgi:ATP-dependent Clp protease ATP-binding subunit ClpC